MKLFDITKKSILSAAGGGMTAAAVLQILERLSAKPIPANVAREITEWFDQCRRITVRSAVLIDCPDADTAARVVAASGKQAVSLTDTVVELTDAKAKNELLRAAIRQINTDRSTGKLRAGEPSDSHNSVAT